MSEWNVEKLLDHVQELLGEPTGSFYNISTRLDLMNQAQREMNEEARAIVARAEIPLVLGQREYDLPDDFLCFDREVPQVVEISGQRVNPRVVDVGYLETVRPQWQDETGHRGTPEFLFVRNGAVMLYPTPTTLGTLHVPYVVLPDELVDMDDVPFNGITRLNRFAPALAYKVAFISTIGRAPQLAGNYQSLYAQQERLMRHFTRSNPQKPQSIRPTQER